MIQTKVEDENRKAEASRLVRSIGLLSFDSRTFVTPVRGYHSRTILAEEAEQVRGVEYGGHGGHRCEVKGGSVFWYLLTIWTIEDCIL